MVKFRNLSGGDGGKSFDNLVMEPTFDLLLSLSGFSFLGFQTTDNMVPIDHEIKKPYTNGLVSW